MRRRFVFILALLAIVAVIGFYFWDGMASAEDQQDAGSAGMNGQSQAQEVAVLTVEAQKIALSKSLPGRISALRQSQVRPQVNGIITERLFEEGAQVEKGQQLYQIDDARYKAALNSAKADLQSARSTIASVKARTDRYEELVKIGAVSRQEYDDVKAQFDQANASVAVANAAVDVAQVNLGYTKVYAPITGRIGRSLVTEGALVTANQMQPLAVITELDPVYVDMKQASGQAMELQQARLGEQEEIPVTLMLGENNQITYPHTGSLKFSEVTIDETTGSVTLRATVPNPDGVLMPGLFVRASLSVGETEALLVPQRATTRNPDGSLGVWTVDENNKAHPKTVEVGDAYKDSWIILNGLTSGETIIVEGYQKVGPRMDVSTTPWKMVDNENVNSEPIEIPANDGDENEVIDLIQDGSGEQE